MLNIKVSGIEEAIAACDPRKVQRAAARSLTKVIEQARTTAVNEIANKYNIKKSEMSKTSTGKNRLIVKPASMSNLEASLTITGRPISLSYFGAQQITSGSVITRGKDGLVAKSNKRLKARGPLMTGVSVEVFKGKRTTLRRAFMAKVKSGHIGVFVRKGKERYPILYKSSITIASMVNRDDIKNAIVARINEQWGKTFEHELSYELSKS
jgi:hypothetical protein